MERIIPILSDLKPKWGHRICWVTHTLLLLRKRIRVFILCFPLEKWKSPPFYGTKRNMNPVVASAPNSILTMTYKALHKSGSIHSPSSCQYPSYLTQLTPLTDFLSVPHRNQYLSYLTEPAYMFFLLTECFPYISSHCHWLVSARSTLWGRMSQPPHGAVQHVNLPFLISLFCLLPLLECKLHKSQTVFYLVFSSTGNT